MPRSKPSRDENIVSIIDHKVYPNGLWKNENCLLTFVTLVGNICLGITLITQIVGMYLAKCDYEKLFECFSVFTFCGMGFFKITSLKSNYKKWLQLLEDANELEHEELDEETSDIEYNSDNEDSINLNNCFEPHIQRYTDQFRKLTFIIDGYYCFSLCIFVSMPLIEYTFRKIMGEENVGLPYVIPKWTPLDKFGLWGYSVTVASDVITCVYIAKIHADFDTTIFGIMIFISGQFTLLKDYSQNSGGSGRCYTLSERRDARTHYRIAKCHRILTSLDKSLSELDKMMCGILGLYYFVFTLTLCSVALQLSMEQMTTLQILQLAQYTGGVLFQMFLFCYYGDMILEKCSNRMGEGPYGAAIWCISPKIRRDILLLGNGMSRLRRLNAGPFNFLDLPSFIMIVRAAYSYYAVLRT